MRLRTPLTAMLTARFSHTHFFGRLRRRKLLEILKWGRMLLAFYRKFVPGYTFSVLRSIRLTFSIPRPYAGKNHPGILAGKNHLQL